MPVINLVLPVSALEETVQVSMKHLLRVSVSRVKATCTQGLREDAIVFLLSNSGFIEDHY